MSGHPSAIGKSRRRTRARGGHGTEEEGGAERWLVTYADMLTLLLVLFIVLFSISVVNTSKFIELKASLASAFGTGPKSVLDGGQGLLDDTTSESGTDTIIPGTPADPMQQQAGKGTTDQFHDVPADLNTLAEQQVDNFKKIKQDVNRALDKAGMHGAVQFSMDRRGLVMTVVTNALVFGGNSAVLLPGGQRIMAVLSPELAQIPNRIEVNGYTNQLPASTYPYPSGWELSSARASAVVRYLATHHVAEQRLSATGYNDLDPLLDPSDPKAATRNRRVDIVVMSTLPDSAGDALQAAEHPASKSAVPTQ
jgi:chemotaxis protein MotB